MSDLILFIYFIEMIDYVFRVSKQENQNENNNNYISSIIDEL